MSIFAHIVESGSITGAAEALELSKSVVSQHLKLLEKELGVLLIKRSTRTHSLTSAGREFYESCKEINKMTDVAWHRAQETIEIPKGVIKITAPNALMDVVIAPAIGTLLKEYPQLKPQLIGSDTHLDLISENIDLAIRVGSSPISNLKQKRIGEFRDILCSKQKFTNTKDIDNALYIANSWQGNHISHQFKDENGDSKLYESAVQCKANSFYSCLALIKAGAGIGLIPDFQFNLLTPDLHEVFPELTLPLNQVYALYPYDRHVPLSVRVCIDAIQKSLNEAPDG